MIYANPYLNMSHDLLSLPDDILLVIMSNTDNDSLLSLRLTTRRFYNLFSAYPRQITDSIISNHFADPHLPHHFIEFPDNVLDDLDLTSRNAEYPYPIRQLLRFSQINEYMTAVGDILPILSKPPRSTTFSSVVIKSRKAPNVETKKQVLLYFALLHFHNTLDLSHIPIKKNWPSNVPTFGSPAWEEAVIYVETILIQKIWTRVTSSAMNEMSAVCPWSAPKDIFPLLRTFVRHTHLMDVGEVVGIHAKPAIMRTSCLGWTEYTGRTLSTGLGRETLMRFRMRMSNFGDVCETWQRLYKGTVHDRGMM